MDLRTGDIVTASLKRLSCLYHKAIVVKCDDGSLLFFHNSPNAKNDYGSNLLIETPEEFFKTRVFHSVKHTNLTADEIFDAYDRLKRKTFNLLFYNCEHFVTTVAEKRKKSKQIRFWTVVLVLFVVWVVVAIRARKK